MNLEFLFTLVAIALALLAINFELIKDSEYRREKVRLKERKNFIKILDKVKGVSANPDINDYYRKVKQELKDL